MGLQGLLVLVGAQQVLQVLLERLQVQQARQGLQGSEPPGQRVQLDLRDLRVRLAPMVYLQGRLDPLDLQVQPIRQQALLVPLALPDPALAPQDPPVE